jgi:hypothetical protein
MPAMPAQTYRAHGALLQSRVGAGHARDSCRNLSRAARSYNRPGRQAYNRSSSLFPGTLRENQR